MNPTMETQIHENSPEHESVSATAAQSEGDNASYERALRDELSLKREVVLDFTCLKACLDPQRETSDGEEFNYEAFLCQELSKGEAFSSLEVLRVRNLVIPRPLSPQTEDYYADLLHGFMQLSNLVELDLNGVKLPEELQQHLTFWNMQGLKRLILDNMGLTFLPPSVGRLRHLELLSANGNLLSSLPVTLSFCENLTELNLQINQLSNIPSTVFNLPHLKDLRRLGNPLPELYHGYEPPPHIKISTPTSAQQSLHTLFNPESLQSLCAETVFAHKIDYWARGSSVGPLQCRHLDYLASNFKLCEHCNRVIPNPGGCTVNVMLLRYLDLRLVPVQFNACSAECQSQVLQHYRQLQTQTQTDMDREYEESIREAEIQACRGALGTRGGSNTAVHQSRSVPHSRNSRRCRKPKCSIM